MNKYLVSLFAIAGAAGVVIAAQDTSLTQREVRDPLQLESWLEANASDAQTRIAAVEGGSATITQVSDTLLVGNDSSNQVAMPVAGASDVSLSQDGTNVTITLDDDVVAAAEMADADHGDVAWSSGVASVEALSLTGGLDLPYANKTANYTNTAADVVVSYNTSAVTTNTLPEASTVLGKVFIIALQDDDGDLEVLTDNTDTFDGTNTKATMADAGDSLHIMATAADVYTILVNVGATLATQ